MVDKPWAPVGIFSLKAAFEYVLRTLKALFLGPRAGPVRQFVEVCEQQRFQENSEEAGGIYKEKVKYWLKT